MFVNLYIYTCSVFASTLWSHLSLRLEYPDRHVHGAILVTYHILYTLLCVVFLEENSPYSIQRIEYCPQSSVSLVTWYQKTVCKTLVILRTYTHSIQDPVKRLFTRKSNCLASVKTIQWYIIITCGIVFNWHIDCHYAFLNLTLVLLNHFLS